MDRSELDRDGARAPARTADETGRVKIADEVVAVIAGIAATEVDGVAGMSGGLVGDITGMLSKNPKGVRVEVGEKECIIDLFLIVEYGVRIPEVAARVQENVKRSVEQMTGLTVVEVNIHVNGVSFQEDRKEELVRLK